LLDESGNLLFLHVTAIYSEETRNRMKPVQYILALLRERKLFFWAAFAMSLPQFLACAAAAFTVHVLLSENNIWSILGMLKTGVFLSFTIYYLIALYEAWEVAKET
jgi:hypothetical protein